LQTAKRAHFPRNTTRRTIITYELRFVQEYPSQEIEDEIWQVKLGRVRILWFYDEGRIVVLSHGFLKSTRKTPEAEKSRARSALKEYREAKARHRLKILED